MITAGVNPHCRALWRPKICFKQGHGVSLVMFYAGPVLPLVHRTHIRLWRQIDLRRLSAGALEASRADVTVEQCAIKDERKQSDLDVYILQALLGFQDLKVGVSYMIDSV